jgi:DNA-binding SARP family transcriptional activator
MVVAECNDPCADIAIGPPTVGGRIGGWCPPTAAIGKTMMVHFSVLGPPQVRDDDAVSVAEAVPFVALASSPNTLVLTGRLAEGMWESPPPDAADRVDAAMESLRGTLRAAGPRAAARLVRREEGHVLLVEPDELDLDHFVLLYRQGRAALEAEDPYAAANLLDQALTVWRGPINGGHPAYGWLGDRLAGIDHLRASAAEGRLVARLMLGQSRLAAADAQAMIATDPLDERWHALLVAALRDGGDPEAAEAAHDQARGMYAGQLGLVPDRVRQLLHLALLPSPLRGANWIEPPPRGGG